MCIRDRKGAIGFMFLCFYLRICTIICQVNQVCLSYRSINVNDDYDDEVNSRVSFALVLWLGLSIEQWLYCHVISCALARRGVRRSTCVASGSGAVHCCRFVDFDNLFSQIADCKNLQNLLSSLAFLLIYRWNHTINLITDVMPDVAYILSSPSS